MYWGEFLSWVFGATYFYTFTFFVRGLMKKEMYHKHIECFFKEDKKNNVTSYIIMMLGSIILFIYKGGIKNVYL